MPLLSDALTVPPHPSHKKTFCCHITGLDNLLHPVPLTQKPPPPKIFYIFPKFVCKGAGEEIRAAS